MRSDTRMLKDKYMYYFRTLDHSRLDLFSVLIWDNSINNYLQILDTDKLTSFLFNINYMYEVMSRQWHTYISYRNLMIKRFGQKRNKIFKKEVKSILHRKFCCDIVSEILEYL